MTKEIQENLLCSALEGGSNYWYMIIDSSKGGYMCSRPFVDGGFITITDNETTKKLTSSDFDKASELMKEKYIKHYADAINGHDDATTGDIFLQLAMFGDVIYA